MHNSKLLVVVCMVILLCGCHVFECNVKDGVPRQSEEARLVFENSIIVNGRSFSIEEVNAAVKSVFNNKMYLYDKVIELGDLLHKDVEYELYFDPASRDRYSDPCVYVVVTNILYHPSWEEYPQVCTISIAITEWGPQSRLVLNYTTREKAFVFDAEVVHLGHFSMRIDEVVKPPYETMDDEWMENIKKAIQTYMDRNDQMGPEAADNLALGNYRVYVQKFFKGDEDSLIFFEHENGNIYRGDYYFVHEISGDFPADLNRVELVDDPNHELFKPYFDKVRSDPAVSFEYFVS